MQYFEDFAAGQRFASDRLTVDEAAIKEFAAAYDPQPFHLDDAAARHSLFGGLAASGWHTAALTMRLIVGSEFRPAGGILGFGGELAWLKPVRPGDELRIEAEILEILHYPRAGRVTNQAPAATAMALIVPNATSATASAAKT